MIARWLKRLIYFSLMMLPLLSITNSRAYDNSVLLVDYAASPSHSIASVERIGDPAFKMFSERLLEAIQARFGAVFIQVTSLSDAWENGIAIVRIPVVSARNRPDLVQALTRHKLHGDCLVFTPWAEFSVEYEPRPRIRGIFYWSERQILWDKMLLAELGGSGFAPREHIPRAAFEDLARNYSDPKVSGRSANSGANQAAQNMPPDLLWLFQKSPKSTLAPFSSGAEYALHKLVTDAESAYVALAIWLLDRCASHADRIVKYRNILDLDGFDLSIFE